jgi:hypothetical protein
MQKIRKMKTVNLSSKELQDLIQVNYERMMAFEQVSNATSNSRLKIFFAERAEESEKIAEELNNMLPSPAAVNSSRRYLLPSTSLFETSLYKKPAQFLIGCARQLERNIIKFYNLVIKDMQELPESIRELVIVQHKNLLQSEMLMADL